MPPSLRRAGVPFPNTDRTIASLISPPPDLICVFGCTCRSLDCPRCFGCVDRGRVQPQFSEDLNCLFAALRSRRLDRATASCRTAAGPAREVKHPYVVESLGDGHAGNLSKTFSGRQMMPSERVVLRAFDRDPPEIGELVDHGLAAKPAIAARLHAAERHLRLVGDGGAIDVANAALDAF